MSEPEIQADPRSTSILVKALELAAQEIIERINGLRSKLPQQTSDLSESEHHQILDELEAAVDQLLQVGSTKAFQADSPDNYFEALKLAEALVGARLENLTSHFEQSRNGANADLALSQFVKSTVLFDRIIFAINDETISSHEEVETKAETIPGRVAGPGVRGRAAGVGRQKTARKPVT